MAASEVNGDTTKSKQWVPLGLSLSHLNRKHVADRTPESNPEVFTKICLALGVERTLGFFDVYSLDDPDLLAFIPRPVYALLFTCPHEIHMKAGLSNGGAKQHIKHGSDLDKLLQEAIPLQPRERAQVLYNSQELEAAHKAAAQIRDTQAPSAEPSPGNHFICFSKGGNGHLWELCGGEKGPHDRGTLGEHEDALSERALELGVRSFMKHAGTGDLNFSMVALAPRMSD